MRFHTDDPDIDFLRWDEFQVQQQEIYDKQCVKCAFCKQPIRPYDDPYCYQFYYDGESLHKECLSKMFRSMRTRFEDNKLYADLFDIMEDAFEQNNEISTLEPKTGDY